MIIDSLPNVDLYRGLSPRIAAGLDYLRTADIAHMDPGRHEIDGVNLYVVVQRYETKPRDAGKWEAHRKYIDIQYMAAGTEMMGYANLETLTVTQAYDEANDYLLLRGEGDFLTVHPGMFVLFAPQDAHMPSLAVTHPQPVVKAVVKVRL